MPRRRPRRIQHLHQTLERHLRIGKRRNIHRTLPRQQIRERLPTIQHSPEHQRVHEHTDDIIQRLLTTTSHRSTDRNVIATRQSRQ